MTAPLPAQDPSAVTKAVVPAAGLGTRLRPLTSAIPKELLPIGRLPVLAHVVNELGAAGITEVMFVVSDRKPQIREFFQERYNADGKEIYCAYAVQREQRGLGDALLYAEEWVGADPFVVAFGDCLIVSETGENHAPLTRMLSTFADHADSAVVLVESVPRERVHKYGIVAPADAARVSGAQFEALDIIEKPAPDEAPSALAVAARWILTPSIFDALRTASLDSRGELNLTDPVRMLLRRGRALFAVPLRDGEARRDIGGFGSFFAAFVTAALNDPEFGSSVQTAIDRAARSRAESGRWI